MPFRLQQPHRKARYRLYDVTTVVLNGTEFPEVAYAELNNPRQLVPLTEVLSRFPPSQLSRFIDLSNRSFLCEGVRYNSPYHDLFLRSWSISAEIFNQLLRYEASFCLEELQRQLQRLSRAFNVALDGLLACRFNWQVNLIQATSENIRDVVPTCSEAYSGINLFPIFPPAQSVYTAAAAYALMAMLSLEVRFQQMEKKVRELVMLEEGDERLEGLGFEIEQIRQAIATAPSTALVFDSRNPLRHHINGFDLFVTERYQLREETSHLSLLGLLGLSKTSLVFEIQHDDVARLIRRMASTLANVLCDQTTVDFVYTIGQLQHPAPIVSRYRNESAFAICSTLEDNDEEESQWPSDDIVVAMRATILRRLGHQVNWNQVQLEPLPEDKCKSGIVEMDGIDLENPAPISDVWPFARTFARFCCLRP